MDALMPIGNNGIAQIDAIIESVSDSESAAKAARGMDSLKKLLEAAEKYGEYAVQFCIKEAELYVRIAHEKGWEAELPQGKRSLVSWIRSKSESELVEILKECSDGVRIVTIRGRELKKPKDPRKEVSPVEEFKRISDELQQEFSQVGIITISPKVYMDRWKAFEAPDPSTAKAYTERTRDQILHMGGVGIADGIGTYALPERCDRRMLKDAISARLRSIYADVKALSKLCSEGNMSPSAEGIEMICTELNRMVANDSH